jgi:acetolactate decarboxylase
MKKLRYIALTLCLLISGCITSQKDTAFQTSTIDALLAGVYDGEMSCRQLLKQGSFGIGTFNHLDGEMIVLDNNLYQIKSDGNIYKPALSIKTPFATVCQFKADNTAIIEPGSSFEDVEAVLDKTFPNQNLFYAIKITGQFESIRSRSVPAQKKPYPPLKEVTKNQPEFNMKNISGTIVGFRCPVYVKGINVPGYHLHFISDDKNKGGHVLSLKVKKVNCEVDILNRYSLLLPKDAKEFAETDLSKDRSKELKVVEKR